MQAQHDQTCQQFLTVVRSMSHYALLLDRAGSVVGHSDRFGRLIQYRCQDLIGRSFLDLLAETDKADCEGFVANCAQMADGTDANHDVAVVFDSTILNFRVSPLFCHGDLCGFLAQTAPNAAQDLPKLNFLLENLDQGVWDYDVTADEFNVSPAWYRIRGLDPQVDLDRLNRNWLSQIHPDDRDILQEALFTQTQSAHETMLIEYRHIHADGHWVWILCQAKVVEIDEAGKPSRVIGTETDITQSRQTKDKLDELTAKWRLAVDAAGIGVWEFNPATETVHWDDRMLEIYGISDGANTRKSTDWEAHLHPEDQEATVDYAAECTESGADFRRDYRIMRPNGDVRYVRSRAGQFEDSRHGTTLVGVNIDVTEDYTRAQELEKARAQLQHESRHDALTGLGNRRLLDETTALLSSHTQDPSTYAVLHLDLDHFKPVNDRFGHAAGDAVLTTVADRLRHIVGEKGTAFRIGGDEFAVFIPVAPPKDRLDALCGQIILDMNKPITYEGEDCRIGVSIGCALGKGKIGENADVFINADRALYAAKSAGRNCFRMHEMTN